MSLLLTPTTELEAVNELLAIIGESPVNTLENVGLVDAAVARDTLRSISRTVQAKGWYFNREVRTLQPTLPSKEIPLPSNVLEVDTADGADALVAVTQRGGRLYDITNGTFEFSRSLKCELVFFLPFDYLPQAARHYITIRAGRVFQSRFVGSRELNSFSETDEIMALADLRRADNRVADHNILTDTYSVLRTINRGYRI